MTAKPIRTLIIKPEGQGEIREIPQEIQSFQGLVGGYIQAVPAFHNAEGHPRVLIWCNEDGMNLDLPINHRATALWWALDETMRGVDRLNGTVFLTGGPDNDSDVTSLPEFVERVWLSVTGQ